MNNFNNLSLFEQVGYLSDLFAEVVCSITYTTYKNLSEEEQLQAIKKYHEILKDKNIELTKDIVDEAEKQFIQSPLPTILRRYGYKVPKTSKFSELADKLVAGRKVTLIKFGEFGFPVVIQTVVDSVNIKPYAQYEDALHIIHKPKRKRTNYKNIIYGMTELLVYDGWVDIDLKSFTHKTIKETASIKIEQSKYLSFDGQFLKDIMEFIKVQPLAFIK